MICSCCGEETTVQTYMYVIRAADGAWVEIGICFKCKNHIDMYSYAVDLVDFVAAGFPDPWENRDRYAISGEGAGFESRLRKAMTRRAIERIDRRIEATIMDLTTR